MDQYIHFNLVISIFREIQFKMANGFTSLFTTRTHEHNLDALLLDVRAKKLSRVCACECSIVSRR